MDYKKALKSLGLKADRFIDGFESNWMNVKFGGELFWRAIDYEIIVAVNDGDDWSAYLVDDWEEEDDGSVVFFLHKNDCIEYTFTPGEELWMEVVTHD
jgi:hypothetical protein